MSEPLVETRAGKIRGLTADETVVFRGIPYARPPIGDLRLRPPQREAPWSGVRDVLEFSPAAPQNPSPVEEAVYRGGLHTSEDCLYLNVWTPGLDHARRPVMVWIHGGAFVTGSGSMPWYDGTRLAAEADVVVVAINYRLGALGFLHLEEITEGFEGSGNLGVLDQIAALEWVRENIAGFGGDPDNVTVFGESAGGMSVGTLMAVPRAKGLFRRALLQSGAGSNAHDLDYATSIAAQVLTELGIDAGSAARLRDLPVDAILQAQAKVLMENWPTAPGLPFQPVADGVVLPDRPVDAVASGSSGSVEVLLGTTLDEMRLFALVDPSYQATDEAKLLRRATQAFGSEERAQRAIEVYRSLNPAASPGDLWVDIQTDRIFRIPALRLAEAREDHEAATYMYLFEWCTAAFEGRLGSCHALEIPFVFGTLDDPGAQMFAGVPDEGSWLLSERMRAAWTSFAREGRPAAPGLPEWPRYATPARETMLLGPSCRVERDPLPERRRLWDGVI